jgi:predicted ATPase
VGTQGEFTAQVLALREREQVREALRHPDTERRGGVTYLGKQVELWLGDLVPGLELRAQSFQGTNSVALRMRRSSSTLDWLRPTNMAFGVSYALPIIVAGLLSPPGSLFLIENPEAHLHPSGQSRIGRFLARLAATGVQVVVETHSDHVLNGIRLAVATREHPITPEQVVIHHFDAQPAPGSRSTEISVTPTGGLSTWPKGFFDQSEQDLALLVKARRSQ